MKRITLPYGGLFTKISLLFVLLMTFTVNTKAQTLFSTVADAVNTGGNCYRLTTAEVSKRGAIWNNNTLDLNYNFDISFTFNFGNISSWSGGDGMAFVLQPSGLSEIGISGSGKGYGNTYDAFGNITVPGVSPSVVVEYDTYDDFGGTNGLLSLLFNGDYRRTNPANVGVPQSSIGFINDGLDHAQEIVWNAATKTMTVYTDGILRFTYTRDFVKDIFSNQNKVYFGFTAGTGGSVNQQSVCYNAGASYFEVPSTFTSITGSSNVTCHGAADGKITDSLIGGLKPYSIYVDSVLVLSNLDSGTYTINNFSPGIHTITARDASFFPQTSSVFISEPALPVIDTLGSTVICSGDSVKLSVSPAAGKNLKFYENYVEAPSTKAWLSSGLTVEAWVKTDFSGASQYIFSNKNDDQQNGQYGLVIVGGKFQFHMFQYGVAYVQSTTDVQDGVWYHVAGTWDGSTMKLYVNGINEGSAILTGPLTPSTDSLQIGRLGLNNATYGSIPYYFYGNIDEVRIWDKARTFTEINDLKNKNFSADSTLVAYYQFDEGTGTLASDAVRGNTGTLRSTVDIPQWVVSDAPIKQSTITWSSGGTNADSLLVTSSGTYYANVTTGSGCAYQTSPVTITVNPITPTPAIAASGATTFCTGGSVILTSSALTGNTWNTGEATQAITVSTAGSFSVTVTGTCGSYSSSPTIVTVNQIPATPVITASGPLSLSAGQTVTLTASAATSYLWNNGATSQSIVVGTAEVGTYTVTVANNGCSATSSPTSVSSSDVAPVINVPADITVNNDPGVCGAVVNFTATETTGVPASTITYSHASGSSFPVGTTIVTATATNSVGTSIKTFKVTVIDNEKPVFSISTPGTATVTIPAMQTFVGDCTMIPFNFSDPLPAGAVVTGVDLTYSAHDQGWGGSDQPDDLYLDGTHIASSVYTHATQTFNTTFTGAIPGYVYGGNNVFGFVFTCYPGWQGFILGGTMTIHYTSAFGPKTVNSDAGTCEATVVLTAPPTSDNCGVASVTNDAPATFSVGTTNVNWTATDTHGNTNTITQTITVVDNQPPVVTTKNISVQLSNGSATITAADINNGSTDNCGITSYSLDKTSFDCSNIGTNTVTLTVTDIHGNSAYATANVIVNGSVSTATVTASGPTTFCSGGSVTLTASAGSSYLWSTGETTPSIIVSSSGSYTVTESGSSGCTTPSAPTVVTVNPISTLTITPANPVICSGSSLTLNSMITAGISGSVATPIVSSLSEGGQTSAKLVVGLRKLVNTYAGPAFRLRRSSDNAESDFGFSGNELDLTAISTFLGGSSGFVTTLYDQSGNGGDVTQTNTDNQPTFISNGLNGKPNMHMTSSQFMNNAVNYPSPFTVVYAARQTGPSRFRMLSSVSNNWLLGWWGTLKGIAYYEGWLTLTNGNVSSNGDSNPYVYTGSSNGSNSSFIYQNGTLLASTASGFSGPNGISLNRSGIFGESSDGDFSEVYIFNTELSTADRQLVENSAASYYSIYAPSSSVAGPSLTVNPTATTAYTINAIDVNGCAVSNSITVTVTSIDDQSVTAAPATICGNGSSTVTVGATQLGINYTLRNNANNAIVAGPIAGTGSAINFNTGSIPATTTYNVLAEKPSGQGSLNFNGNNSYVSVPDNNAYNTSSITLEAMVYFNGSNNIGNVILKGNYGWGMGITNDGTIEWWNQFSQNAGPNSTAGAVPVGQWTHIAVTVGGGQTKFYVNGVLNAVANEAIINNNNGALYFGTQGECLCNNFDGKIDEIRIWNTVRTQVEIDANKNACLSGSEAGLVSLFKFNDGTGTTTVDAKGVSNGILNNFDPTTAWSTSNPAITCGSASCSLQLTATPTVTIASQPTPTISASGPTTFCSGGSVTLTASAGSSYLWSTGETAQSITVSTAGSYAVTVTNATGCSAASAPIDVTVNPLPTANITAGGPTTFCAGGSVALTVSSGSGSGNGNALTFNGANRVTVSNSSLIPVGNSSYTIEAWIKPKTVSGANGIIGWGNWGAINQTNAIRFEGPTTLINYWWTNDLYVTTPNVLDGQWHHIAATFNGTTRSIYMDGVLLGSDTPSGHNVPSGTPMYIAETNPISNEYFDGAIDEVRIWNIGKSQAQITTTMNTTVPVNSAGLVAYYKMDEGSGVTTADATNNGNTGTLTGNPVWNVPSTSPVVDNFQSINWSAGGATTNSINVTTSGSYSATVTNAAGCSVTSAPVTVTVGTNAAPVPDMASLPVITGECSASATAPTATDGCGNTITGVASGPVSFNAQGTYSITWTYTSANGISASQTQQVIVKDITAPTINTIPDITTTAASVAGSIVNYTAPVGTDNCSGVTTTLTTGPASGSTFNVGSTLITYTATDAVGLTATSSFHVIVSGIAPSISVPNDFTVNNDPGKCGAIVNFTATETTGVPASTITYSIPSGSLLPIGTTTVTATATNALGISTKTFKVTVTDTEKPVFVIVTPGTATVTIPAMQTIVSSCATAVYNFMDPLPAGAVITGIDLSYSAADQGWGLTGGNTRFYVGGKFIGGNQIIDHFIYSLNFNYAGNIPGYVYGGNNSFEFGFECFPGWQGFFYGGTMTIHYQTALSQITVNNDPGKCGAAVILTTPAVTDNCSVASIQNNAPALFPIGTTNVTWTATDVNGNINTSVQTVTITDNEAPGISVPADLNINPDNGSNTATNVNLGTATTSDNCGVASVTNDAPAAFPTGATTVTWTVTDTHGNSTSASQIVTVADKTPPVLRSMSLDITKNNDLGVCGAVVTYIPPVANDNASTTNVTITEGGGDGIISFDTQLSYNVSSLDFVSSGMYQDIVHGHGVDISVGIELFNPQSNIWIPVQTIQTGTGDYHFDGVSFKFPAITQVSKIRFVISQPVYAAFHVYDLAINLNSINVVQTGGLPSGSVFPIGKTINTFSAIDLSGNVATSGFTVTIYDAEKPSVTNYTSSTHNADASGSWIGSPSTITISDNCPNTVLVTENYIDQLGKIIYTGTSTVSPGNYVMSAKAFPTGVNTVYVSVSDGAGNVNQEAKFTVTVMDVTPPTISVTPVINKNNSPGFCSANVVVPVPVVADNCTVASLINSYNNTFNATDRYPVGSTVITWTVTDASGNKTTVTQTIVVTDNEAPVIAMPIDIIQTVDAGTCGAVVNWSEARVTDNCGILSSSSNHRSGETFPIGATTVIYTATDIHNNTITASFTITITDNQAPKVITKPITVTLINGAASILASDINNGSFDNCGAVTLVASKTNFTCADAGLNSVILTVTDRFGNMASDIALVTVVGEVPTSSIAVIPNSTVFTGGVPTNLYLGYGSTGVTLNANVTGITPITYTWSGSGLSCTNCQSPVFIPTAPGNYTFTVVATNKYGCSTTSTVSVCVRDIRVTPAAANSRVFVCHTDLLTGITQTLQLLVNQVAAQLTQNPQDLLGSCGMPACAATAVNTEKPATAMIGTKEIAEATGEEKLSVKVSPNPSNTVFTFVVTTARKTPVHVRLMDGAGRTIESLNNAPIATTFKMGEKLFSGIYYAEFIQDNERVVVKLIKQIR